MPRETLLRLAALAAILGGIARGVDSFAFEFMDYRDSAILFLATDIALMLSLFGIYGLIAGKAGWLGLGGFVIAFVGFVMVRSAGDNIDSYVQGATVVAIGMAIFGVAILVARAMSPIAPVLWIVALAAGVFAYFIESDWIFEFAGVAFGLGFVVAGIELFRRAGAAEAAA